MNESDIELEHARVMRVRPGDTVILTTVAGLEPRVVARLQEKLERLFPDNECVVLSGLELSVARPER